MFEVRIEAGRFVEIELGSAHGLNGKEVVIYCDGDNSNSCKGIITCVADKAYVVITEVPGSAS